MLSVRIAAHDKRREWALALSDELDAPIIWDEQQNAWETHRRALLSAEGSHVLIIQDDALPSEGMLDCAREIIRYSTVHPISLFAQRRQREKALERFDHRGLYLAPGPTYGVAVIIPTWDITHLIRAGDVSRGTSYDRRLSSFYSARRIGCLYTSPSLVDHRLGPSLMGQKDKDRPAHNFGSGVGVDWSAAPLVADRENLYPLVAMTDGRRVKHVRMYQSEHRRCLRNGWVEQSPP